MLEKGDVVWVSSQSGRIDRLRGLVTSWLSLDRAGDRSGGDLRSASSFRLRCSEKTMAAISMPRGCRARPRC